MRREGHAPAAWRSLPVDEREQAWFYRRHGREHPSKRPARDFMKDARVDGVSETDAADIAASLNGQGDAYERLVRRYQDQIAATMWRFSRDRARCEELVHDVFVEAYLGLGSYRGQAPFLHWLRRIATRVGYRHWKQRARERARAPVPLDEGVVADVAAGTPDDPAAASERLERLLARLPPRDALVLTLLYLEDCSVQETAERTGWSRTLVKVQAHRARKKLRKLLETQ